MRSVLISTLSLLAGAGGALAADHVVTQKGKAFSQDKIEIASGDTITFKNDDETSHNVFSTSETMKFNIGVQKSGSAVAQKFEKPGEVQIRCAIHPNMKLTVVVK